MLKEMTAACTVSSISFLADDEDEKIVLKNKCGEESGLIRVGAADTAVPQIHMYPLNQF